MRWGFYLLIFTGAFLILATFFLVRWGQGYRIVMGRDSLDIKATGLLVSTSIPDGASIYINTQLTSATNTTLNLPPGDYTIKIVKEGYLPWEKRLKIQKEVVTQAQALLIPQSPRLDPLTATGVLRPIADPSGTKIAYGIASASATAKNGLYVLDMKSIPILALRNSPLQIESDSQNRLSTGELRWSPNGTELIVSTKAARPQHFLLRTSELNPNPQDISSLFEQVQSQWDKEEQEKELARQEGLKPELAQFIQSHFHIISWSPDETKVFYEATASATLARFTIPPLLGGSTESETRELAKGQLYVYDTKEDKNFRIDAQATREALPIWFPDNRHLVFIENHNIKIVEYDGTNRTTVYSGPLEGNFIHPWPDGSRLVILTTLNPQAQVTPSLYTINLK